MVDFGGWEMPVQYSGILDEHRAVRNAVGLFDVSHMGEIEVRGVEAAQLVDFVATNHAAKLKPGQAHYSGLLYETGGFVDDILVHKVDEHHFFLCVNASNQEKDYEHIRTHNRFRAEVEFASGNYAQLAIQGPAALGVLQKLARRGSGVHSVLLVRGRRGRRHCGADRAHWIHGRGRIRNIRRARACAARVGRNSCGGQGSRHQAMRAGRAKHAAA